MIEEYTDKATTYADQQKNLVVTNNTNNNNQQQYPSPTNSIPPNYNINGTVNTNAANTNKTSTYSVENDKNTYEGLFYSIFNKSNIVLVLWFLAIYFVAYFILGFVFNKNEDVSNYQLRLSRTIDIISLFCLLVIIISTFATYNDDQKQTILQNTLSSTSNFINEPFSIFSVTLFLIAFYIVVYLFRIPMSSETKPIIFSFIESVAWIFFVIIVFTDFFKYVLGVSLMDLISDFFDWSSLPEYGTPTIHGNVIIGNVVATSLNKTSLVLGNVVLAKPVQQSEVFNISNNLYTYDDAQAICSSYGAALATYDQIEDAYKNGGEWCNYGWSDGQMAFFPTQKATWEKLQKNPEHKNDCGRPGVNGGYFANPYIKFGVNCYGKKPKPTDNDLDRLKMQNNSILPKTAAETELDKKVQYWKENADKMLVINSYNKNAWSEY
jgi:hypothetical protein